MVRALTRHVNAQVGLDLSTLPLSAFKHFVNITYSRSNAKSADTLTAAMTAAMEAIAAGVQPPPAPVAKAAGEAVAKAAVAAVTVEDSLSGLKALAPLDPAAHSYEQVSL